MKRTISEIIFIMAVGTWFLLVSTSEAASNESIQTKQECANLAKWAGSIYDTVKENPDVMLNAVERETADRMEFIKRWVRDGDEGKQGKSKEDLIKYVTDQCNGVKT